MGDNPRKLPVFRTVGQTWLFVIRHQRDFWRLIWLPVLVVPTIIPLMHLAGAKTYDAILHAAHGVPGVEPEIKYLLFTFSRLYWGEVKWTHEAAISLACLFFVAAIILRAWHDYVVRGTPPRIDWRRPIFGMRELRIFLLLYGISMLSRQLVNYPLNNFRLHFLDPARYSQFPDIGSFPASVLTLVLGLAAFVAVLRTFLLLPLYCEGEAPSPRHAWSLAKGTGLHLLAIIFLVELSLWVAKILIHNLLFYSIPLLTSALGALGITDLWNFMLRGALGPFDLSSYLWKLKFTLTDIIELLFMATALSLCYRHLTGMEGTVEEGKVTGIPATADP